MVAGKRLTESNGNPVMELLKNKKERRKVEISVKCFSFEV